jgi:FkbM family methyltransferase
MGEIVNNTINRVFLKAYAKYYYKYFNKRLKLKSVYDINLLFNEDSTFSYCLDGDYGDLILNQINKLNKGDLFIDIGANQGLFSIIASNKGAKVISFEPNFEIFKIFVRNISINKCENIYPLNVGIFNQLTEKSMFTYKNKSGKAFVQNKTKYNNILTVDRSFIQIVNNIQFENCMIKIDVEGAEYIVLLELEDVIKSNDRINTIIIEINPDHLKRFNSKVEDIYILLKEYNYKPSTEDKSNHYDEIFIKNSK